MHDLPFDQSAFSPISTGPREREVIGHAVRGRGTALTASWFVAVLFTPLTGVFILPDKLKGHGHEPSRFARAFHRMLDRVLRMKYWVIGTTVALFAAGLVGMQFVPQQFFPNSDRPELLVDLTLPQGSSINATRKTVDDLERILKTAPDIEHWSFYVGRWRHPVLSAPRPAACERFLCARRDRHQGAQGSPKGDFTLIEVGYFELNRNPENVFAEVEQAALSPANIVPGIGYSPDKMLQARLFSYGDAQRYRLGVNHHHIPVNAPKCPFLSYHRDGAMRTDGNLGGTPI